MNAREKSAGNYVSENTKYSRIRYVVVYFSTMFLVVY